MGCKPNAPKDLLITGFFCPPFTRMPTSLSKTVTRANDKEKLRNADEILQKLHSSFVKSLTFGSLTYGPCPSHEGTHIISWPLTTCQMEVIGESALPTPMIPDLCYMQKYGVTHRLTHRVINPQQVESVEVSIVFETYPFERTIALLWSGTYTIGSPDLQTFPKDHDCGEDCPDCEGSRVLSFVYLITRASNPQLHFGKSDIQSNRLTFDLLAHFINGLRIT
ncbi:hypothetical protein Tco_0910114 [Tanacetum coccineum]|uniref:Uncharacterized protein n=1 Tax=Tanacetum coccineum TaxID=301880 RepID=A0ABQ5CSZ2_9ASTR